MKLFFIHCGFYDAGIQNGTYELHANFFITAEDIHAAKRKINIDPLFRGKKMHIDSVQEILTVEGFAINLTPLGNDKTDIVTYMGRDLRSIPEK